MSIGKLYVSALLEKGDVSALMGDGNMTDMMLSSEKEVYDFVYAYARQYSALPKPDTVYKHLGVELPDAEEPSAYYLDLLKSRNIERMLKSGMQATAALLQPDNKDPEAALASMAECVMQLIAKKNAAKVIDFRNAYDIIWQAYTSQYTGDNAGTLKFGWPTLDVMSGGLSKGDLASFVGRPAQGKALANGTPVLMQDGRFKPVEKIKIGDRLASVDGKPSQVYGTYPQGMRKLYKVHFADGRTLTVDGSHLWQVGCKYWERPRILTTLDILDFRTKAKRYKDALYVPTMTGDFGSGTPSMNPYLLGVLLGDGCLTKEASFTTMDEEVLVRVEQSLPKGYCVTLAKRKAGDTGKADTYRIVHAYEGYGSLPRNEVIATLKSMGVFGRTSLQKELPPEVFAWSRADRVALLQGLMDTDGSVCKNTGQVTFSSSSQALLKGVCRLVQSLGGKAPEQKPRKTVASPHYRASIIMENPEEAFHLTRKKSLCRRYTQHDPRHLRIVDITESGTYEATCIAVTHESRLFIAGDYIVTHNTWQMLYSALFGWLGAGPESVDQSRMFVSMEMGVVPIQQRLTSLLTHLPAKQIKDASLSTKGIKLMKAGLLEIKTYAAPFYVVDGNLAATVEDLWALVRMLNPRGVFIDGGYLLKHPRERDRFKRVAENADLVKSELAAEAPTAVSWQFAKSASKKNTKKGEKVDLDDIGYTDAIAQVSSLVLGLTQPDSVETLNRRRIDILKGRNGETGHFFTNWDFQNMDFTEYVEKEPAELQFV